MTPPVSLATDWLRLWAEHLICAANYVLCGNGGEIAPTILATVAIFCLCQLTLLLWRRIRQRWLLADPVDSAKPWTALRLLTPLVSMVLRLLSWVLPVMVLLAAKPDTAAWGVPLLAWLAIAIALGATARIAYLAIDPLLKPWQARARQSSTPWDDLLLELLGRIARSAILFACLYGELKLIVDHEAWQVALDRLLALGVIATLAWILISLVHLGDSYLTTRFRIDVADNLAARRVFTQLVVLRRMAYLLIGLIAVSLALMQFDSIRQIGTSILASAGLAGVIIGFAAQRTLANLLAGVQIALTQPIRIDDALLIEGEFGRVEEITLTYVVIALWDNRRLIVPLTRIIEVPFQNWTRLGSHLLGTVTIRCDFQVPVAAIRDHARALVEADRRWDKRAFAVQVTEWGERTVEVRVLISANDTGTLFDLRCAMREALLTWLAQTYPDRLPQSRWQDSSASPALPESPAQPGDQR